MSFTVTRFGEIAHHQHTMGFLCPIKVIYTRDGKAPYPQTRTGKQGALYYAFALPGGGEILIPERGVRITKTNLSA